MGVKGNLKDMSLTGLISINCNEGNQACLHLQRGTQEALIYFDAGQIVHMVLDGQEGEKVLCDLLLWEDGVFELERDVPPPARTVFTPWTNLVLEGMQILDECRTTFETPDLEATTEQSVNFEIPILEEPTTTGPIEQETIEQEPVEPEEEDMAANMRETLMELEQQVPGFIAAAVIGMDGLGLAEHASRRVDMELIDAQLTLLFKLVDTTVNKLKAGALEDYLLTTNDAYVLLRFLEDKRYYLGLIADRRSANLGNMRLNSRVFAGRLDKLMPR